mmetsp:Transcript_9406/g.17395  ORF Transcript_9406/g.17395 Transcript_9406/m.17395 type:complete len:224 (+) Transcript_9406:96-767(+)
MAAVPFARSFVLLVSPALVWAVPSSSGAAQAMPPMDRLQKEVEGLLKLRSETQKEVAGAASLAEGGAERNAMQAVSVAQALLEEENQQLREALAKRQKSMGQVAFVESGASRSASARGAAGKASDQVSSFRLVLVLQAAMVVVGIALALLFWSWQRADRSKEARLAKLQRSRYGSPDTAEPARRGEQGKPTRLPAGVVDEDEEEPAAPTELRFAPPKEVWTRM